MTPTRRGTPDFLLLFLTFLLVCFGLAFVFSAGMAYKANDPGYLAVRQGMAIALGTAAMFFCMNVDYMKFQRWVAPFLIVVVILLLAVPVIGRDVNGAKSWIYIGSFGLQPTEFAKLAVILYLAAIISKKGERFREFQRGLLPPLVVLGFLCALIMLQPDLGSTMILVLTSVLVISVGGANLKHIFYMGITGGALACLAITAYIIKNGGTYNYRIARFTSFLDPWSDPDKTGFHLVQSLYAFGHGGFSGAGFGQSIQKLHYLPEAHNDFIFAIIGEELGFVGASLFLMVYLAFIWRGLIVALRCKELFGTLTGVGIVGLIGIQAFINIGGVTASIPLTGVTLPLISYGGSSILVTLVSIGILLSISREHNKVQEKKPRKGYREQTHSG